VTGVMPWIGLAIMLWVLLLALIATAMGTIGLWGILRHFLAKDYYYTGKVTPGS